MSSRLENPEWNRTKEGGEDARQSESVVVENALSFLLLLAPLLDREMKKERRAKLDAVHGPENSRPLFRSRSTTPDTTR